MASAPPTVPGMPARNSVSGQSDLQSYVFSAGLVALSPWLAGRATRARDQRAAALEREREERERAAASEERQRIARELHDVVAHGVVLMVLQAQGARRILDQDPERARAALGAIEETGQHALGELRRSLGLVRDRGAGSELQPQPGLADLATLVEEMREVGLQVELRIEGPPRPLADAVDRSAYRIVQEALTNTVKHAGLVSTRVTITYASDDLRVEITDDGPGPPARGDGAGHGLAGMRERVRLYGGELDAHAGERRGFVVRARIPLGA
jgi:signal transduction histidine kinase